MSEAHASSAEPRLDAFVDAAFAFALTLLVIGSGSVPDTFDSLSRAVSAAPAFLIGFALIAMFWHGHVRWRRYGGGLGAAPTVLSLLLVFLVLLYVYPLRLMATSLVDYASGTGRGGLFTRAEIAGLFQIYGAGFSAMAFCAALLFRTCLARPLVPEQRAGVRGEIAIWSMLGLAGLTSMLLASIAATVWLAPWIYSLLPIAIGLYVWRRDWTGTHEEISSEAV